MNQSMCSNFCYKLTSLKLLKNHPFYINPHTANNLNIALRPTHVEHKGSIWCSCVACGLLHRSNGMSLPLPRSLQQRHTWPSSATKGQAPPSSFLLWEAKTLFISLSLLLSIVQRSQLARRSNLELLTEQIIYPIFLVIHPLLSTIHHPS